MKPLFQFIINVMCFYLYTLGSFFLLIWYGKLNRVSMFHTFSNKYCTPQKPSDHLNEFFQSEHCVSEVTRKRIERETLHKILNHPKYRECLFELDVKIYSKGKIIGSETVGNVLTDIIN